MAATLAGEPNRSFGVDASDVEAGERDMASYRLYFLKSGQIVGNAHREFADDLEAVDSARKLSTRFEIEIWLDDKLVAGVNECGEPLGMPVFAN